MPIIVARLRRIAVVLSVLAAAGVRQRFGGLGARQRGEHRSRGRERAGHAARAASQWSSTSRSRPSSGRSGCSRRTEAASTSAAASHPPATRTPSPSGSARQAGWGQAHTQWPGAWSRPTRIRSPEGSPSASGSHRRSRSSHANLAPSGSRTVGILFGAARWSAYAGFALLVGVVVFVTCCWRSGFGHRRLRRLLAASWTLLATATVGCLAVTGSLWRWRRDRRALSRER